MKPFAYIPEKTLPEAAFPSIQFMMKKMSFLLLSLYIPYFMTAQSFLGYRTGNYTGVYSSFFNPAGVAQNHFSWDVSIGGANTEIANNNTFFKFKDLKTVLSGNTDISLLGNIYEKMSAFAGGDVTGPSFMLSKKNWGIAFTSRLRAMVNFTDLDGNLINSINNYRPVYATPYTLKSSANQLFTANGWTETGLSLAKVFHENEQSVFKMGITGKYLAGSANSWLQIKDLQGTIYKDALSKYYLSDAGATVSTGYSGFDINNFQAADLFTSKGRGWGAAIGLSYEIKQKKDSSKKNLTGVPYRLRLGVSLTDVGMIRYNAADVAAYSMAITAPQAWYPSGLDGKSINEIRQYLDTSSYFTNTSSGAGLKYNVRMPMSLNINADIPISRIFYTDVSAHVNLAGKSNMYSPFVYTSFSVTPRFETPRFGFYFPFTYSTLSDFNAGLSLRLGPVFIGSGRLFMVLINNSKLADIHAGIRFGGFANKTKKKKKAKEEPAQITVEVKKDTDKDGIDDKDDKCPEVFGVARHDGCPVPDTDSDGISDEDDKCPNTPGTEKYNGCPIPDTDKDGVDDEKDKCPQLQGTIANNGCPEVKKEIAEKVSYAARRVYFNTASYQLRSVSYKGLNEVVNILKADPNLKLTVEGHTDNIGIADKNKILSLQRAYAVKEYLVQKGIKASRITIAGYGEEQPVADNATPEGRAQNRRVIMKVEY